MTNHKPRALRRAEARHDAKVARDRQRHASLEPGGSPERPIAVATAALVEPKARAAPCVVCGGSARLEDHAASSVAGLPLRLARMHCPACGHRRTIHFVIRPDLPN